MRQVSVRGGEVERWRGVASIGASWILAVVAAASAALGFTRTSVAADTYYIDESTDFSGNGCENEDLNTVTSSLRSRLNAYGWTGSRFTNASAWPQDFLEGCSTTYGSGGLDGTFADQGINGQLAVYAGHGDKGSLQWGFKRSNRCSVAFQTNMRLGSMNGGDAGYAVYLTSCTLHTSVRAGNWQWLNQQFGYHNSPSIGDNQAADWFDAIDEQTNAQAWLDEMEDKPGWFTGDNSPIVWTQGENLSVCLWQLNNGKLRQVITGRAGGPVCGGGQPAFHYCTIMRNNGDSGC